LEFKEETSINNQTTKCKINKPANDPENRCKRIQEKIRT
jgi:hypothetical protein